VTRRVLSLAEAYYASGISGIGLLPPSCRPAILAAALLYREIGRRVLAQGGDGITSRARVGTGRRLALLALAVVRAVADPRLRNGAGRLDAIALHATLRRVGVMP